MSQKVLKVHPDDNVIVALQDLPELTAFTEFDCAMERVVNRINTAIDNIPLRRINFLQEDKKRLDICIDFCMFLSG